MKAGVAATAGVAAAGVAVARHPGLRPGRPGAQSPSAARRSRSGDARRAPAASRATPRSSARRSLLPAGSAAREQAVHFTCPAPLRVADLLPPTGAKLRVAYAPATDRRREPRRAHRPHRAARWPTTTRVTVSILCRRPDGGRVDPRRRPAHGGDPDAPRPRARRAAAGQPRRAGARLGPPRSAGHRGPHLGLVVARPDGRRDARLAALPGPVTSRSLNRQTGSATAVRSRSAQISSGVSRIAPSPAHVRLLAVARPRPCRCASSRSLARSGITSADRRLQQDEGHARTRRPGRPATATTWSPELGRRCRRRGRRPIAVPATPARRGR